MTGTHREAFALLEWGLLHEPSHCTLLVGEPGTGKTTLLQSLLNRDYYKVRIARAGNPAAVFDEFLREVMYDFGIGAGPSRREMLEEFDRFLSSIEPGGRAVVVVDDAQALTDAVLDEIHLLLKRRTIDDRRLHFILVGQRQLARRLLQPELRELNDSIGARAILDRMSRKEAFDYIEYWLQTVGGKSRTVFGWRALVHIVEHGGGIPRRLNVLCHNALLLASSVGHRKVHLGAARQATSEYAANTPRQYRPWFRSATRGRTAALVVPDSNAAAHAGAGAINGSASAAHRI